MNSNQFWIVLVTLWLFATLPAVAVVVVDEDFEDDTATSYFPLPPAIDHAPGLDGLPTNAGKPGNWLANKYDLLPWFNNPWHDDFDTNPDTNWQLQVTENIGPNRPGKEAFYQNQHTNCDLYLHCVDIDNHDCDNGTYLGLTEPGPCDNDRFSRDGFIQFSLADGTPRPAMPGEKLHVSFDFTQFDGIAIFALTNDIQAMADSTADETLHPAMSKWAVGFGQPFNPMDEGLEAWSGGPQHPNVVSLLTPNEGFNGRGFDSWVPKDPNDLSLGQTPIPLNPDFPNGTEVDKEDAGTAPPYQTVVFEYTVGNTSFDLVTIDFADGLGPQEVRTEEGGAPVPIAQPALTAQGIDGIAFTDTGGKMSHYLLDNICIEVLLAASAVPAGCGAAEPTPLLGDANNDNQVTGGDLIAVQQNFGSVDPNSPSDGLFRGDANDDGQVTGADLIAVQQNFGNVATAAVPEPASVCLVTLVGLGAMLSRRRILIC